MNRKYIMTFEAFIDDKGNLSEFNFKKFYPSKKIEKFIEWFRLEYGDYMSKQGWDIFSAKSDFLLNIYNTDDTIWQVQVVDEPEDFYEEEGNALIGISTDNEAWERAKKIGLMLDENGVVIGYEEELFLN